MQKNVVKVMATLGMALALIVGTAASADAAFKLRISVDGNNDGDFLDAGEVTTVTDDGAGDNLLVPGFISFSSATLPGFTAVGELATSTSPSGDPLLDLSNLIITSANGGLIRLEVTDTGFILPGTVEGDVNGTSLFGTLTVTAYSGIGEFSQLNLIGTGGPFTQNASSAYGGSVLDTIPAGHESLTIVVDLDANPGITSFDVSISAPEPASMALFGMALFGLGGVARRRFATR